MAMHDENNAIVGIMAVHVADLVLAGDGPAFEKAHQALESRLPLGSRKYGEFVYTGVHDRQLSDGMIETDQNDYAEHLHELEYVASDEAWQGFGQCFQGQYRRAELAGGPDPHRR